MKCFMSKINDLIAESGPTVGTFLFSRSQASLEVMADVGFDFVVIGTEHFMVNPETIEHLITAAEAANIVPFVRVQENVNLIQRVLDSGAEGIISPMIDNAEGAKEVVETAKFPPIGNRGVGNPRSTTYGVQGAEYMEECYERQNESQSVILQIETEEALQNLQEVAMVEGVDSLFIGPWDLSHSLSQTGRGADSVILEDKISEVLAKCKEIEIPVGIFAWDGEEANKRIEQGFDYIICGGDVIFLAISAGEALGEIVGTN